MFLRDEYTPSNWPASEAGQLLGGRARVREAYITIASDAIVT
jgi:hypothetical protein